MPYVLGLDLGTTSVSVGALSNEGQVIATNSCPHEAAIPQEDPARAEQSLAKIVETAKRLTRRLAQQIPDQCRGVGLTGQMHGFYLSGKDRQALSPLYTWQDRRANKVASSLKDSYLQGLIERLPTDVRVQAGCEIRAGYAIAVYDALKRTSELPEGHELRHVTAAVFEEMTEQPAKIHSTFAASWGCYSLKENCYIADVLYEAGLEHERLPQLVAGVKAERKFETLIASDWGLPAGIPVFPGIGDHPAATLAAMTDSESEIFFNIGTGGQVAWCSPHCDGSFDTAIEVRPFCEDQALHISAGQVGGATWAWFVDQLVKSFEELGILMSHDELQQRFYRVLSQPASPEQQLPICLPYFLGTRLDPTATGQISGIGPQTNLVDMARSILIGMIDSMCEAYDNASTRLPHLNRVVVTGKLFENFPWLADRISKRWAVDVETPDFQEPAAVGAALNAARSLFGESGKPYQPLLKFKTLATAEN